MRCEISAIGRRERPMRRMRSRQVFVMSHGCECPCRTNVVASGCDKGVRVFTFNPKHQIRQKPLHLRLSFAPLLPKVVPQAPISKNHSSTRRKQTWTPVIIIHLDLSFPKSRIRAPSRERYSILQTIKQPISHSHESKKGDNFSLLARFSRHASAPIPYFKTMHTFGRIENVKSLCDEVEAIEAAITNSELNAQDADCVATVAELLGELRRKLADAEHELAVVISPILILPYEVTAEMFNWHLLMGGNMTIILLICKRWTTVAYSSPRRWSRIAVGDRLYQLRLQGAIRCGDLDKLRAVLSRTRSSPLQLEFSWYNDDTYPDQSVPSTTLRWGPLASSNWVTALTLILDNQVWKRCTYFVLQSCEEEVPVALIDNLSVLPLLSSLYIDETTWSDHGLQFIRSLVKVSPSLRHIRCHRFSTRPQDLGVVAWMKGIESYGWINLSEPCPLLYESPSLREIGVIGKPAVPLTLPTCQVLRWEIPTYSSLHLITAPHLHTLILRH